MGWLILVIGAWVVVLGGVGGHAEAAPVFGDDDAVAGVARVEADLDGEVDAHLMDEVGEGGYVLGALIGDAGDLVTVEQHGGSVAGERGVRLGAGVGARVEVGRGGPASVGDAAVGDTSGEGELVAAETFALFGGGSTADIDVGSGGTNGNDAGSDADQVPRRAQERRQMNWDIQNHRRLEASIAYLQVLVGDCGGGTLSV